MPRILLINPWIYDFAAHDFGIKPIGLLRIAEFLRRQKNEVFLIDCIDNCQQRRDEYGFSKIKKIQAQKPPSIKNTARPYFRYGITVEDFLIKLKSFKNIDEVYITSLMTYWYPGVHEAIRLIRNVYGGIKITLGGIYATLCNEHARLSSKADIIIKNNYLEKQYYLTDGFYPAFDLLVNKDILPLQTSFGCPFRCAYCASAIFYESFFYKPYRHTVNEISHHINIFQTNKFVFYDDALLFDSEKNIKPLLRDIIKKNFKLTFFTPNGLHARYIDKETSELFHSSGFKQIRISLETTDPYIQKNTGRKVDNEHVKNAIKNLFSSGYDSKDIGVYILLGSDFIDIEKTSKDVNYVHSLGVNAVLASYSPIPGTASYNTLIKKGIISHNTDPLWHNKTIFPELIDKSYAEKSQDMRRYASKLNKKLT